MQTFDSNGPDVRIRGSAFQVHEKYLQLARDASSSGDRIMAESYLQHAEHYYRIIAAAQEQQNQQNGGDPNRRYRPEGGFGNEFRGQPGEGGEPGEEGGEDGEGGFRGQQDQSFRQPPEGGYRERGPSENGNYRQSPDRQFTDRQSYDRQPEGGFAPDRQSNSRSGEGGGRRDYEERDPATREQPTVTLPPIQVAQVHSGYANGAARDSEGPNGVEDGVAAESLQPRRRRPRREHPIDQESLAIPEPSTES
jgi:hypothetical protein